MILVMWEHTFRTAQSHILHAILYTAPPADGQRKNRIDEHSVLVTALMFLYFLTNSLLKDFRKQLLATNPERLYRMHTRFLNGSRTA